MIRWMIPMAIAVAIIFFVDVGSTQEHAGHGMHKVHDTEALNVELHTDPETIQTGKPTKLTFRFTDMVGESVSELLVHHDRILHVIVVSENLAFIGHIHPEDFETRDIIAELEGLYTVYFTFPAAGRYLIAVDAMTTGAEFTESIYVDVIGEPRLADLTWDFRREKVVFGDTDEGGDRYTRAVSLTGADRTSTYHARMEVPENIKAGETVNLIYHFSRDGAPLTDLVPFLGAPMHFAVVNTRFDGIEHTHGIVPGTEGTDEMMTDPHAGHSMKKTPTTGHQHVGITPEKFGPTLMLRTVFPDPGVYQIFGQLKHADQILWSSFMVEVQE